MEHRDLIAARGVELVAEEERDESLDVRADALFAAAHVDEYVSQPKRLTNILTETMIDLFLVLDDQIFRRAFMVERRRRSVVRCGDLFLEVSGAAVSREYAPMRKKPEP
jgi:hypothetical protein